MSREYSKDEWRELLNNPRPTAQTVSDRIIADRKRADFTEVNYSDSKRWRMVKEFHPLLRLEHWDGHGWGPLYGEEADKVVDELILKAKP